jgi:hypothetical protein
MSWGAPAGGFGAGSAAGATPIDATTVSTILTARIMATNHCATTWLHVVFA